MAPALSTASTVTAAWSGCWTLDRGRINGRRPFARPPVGVPDGLTVDAEGAVWVAAWGGGHVFRFLGDGSLDRAIALPVSQPSSVCFGGPDLRDLYVTTAWEHLGPERRAKERLAGGLLRCRPGVAGLPPDRYRLDE